MKHATVVRKKSTPIPPLVRSDEMGRPRKSKPGTEMVLSFRVDADLLRDLDEEAKRFAPGVELSRTQLVKLALREWIDSRRQHRGGK